MSKTYLNQVEKTLAAKRVIKRSYEPERWKDFDILDKR